MLIQFSVENFLSIKDNVVLSLLASKDNEHPEHLIVDGNKKHLKSAVIYGANASGKSNVLNAFWFMVNYETIFYFDITEFFYLLKLIFLFLDPFLNILLLLNHH